MTNNKSNMYPPLFPKPLGKMSDFSFLAAQLAASFVQLPFDVKYIDTDTEP